MKNGHEQRRSSRIEYLIEKEWSLGNGQCPACYGVSESLYGHPCYTDPNNIGHEFDCSIAAALSSEEKTSLMKGEYTPDIKYETYTTDNGIYKTRPIS